MKRIWVCGASGMLGTHFKELLKSRKMPFVANDYHQLDITQLDQVLNFLRNEEITHIINCAAYTQVDKAEDEMKEAYLVNAIGPYHLGLAGKKYNARVIHFSTDYVFDGNSKTPYEERHVCSPIGAYGLSKYAGEIKLLEEHEDVCVIRTSWLFGDTGKNFVETMLRLMSQKEELRVVNDQIGRPTYCQDLAMVTMNLLNQEGIYHFANAQQTSWYEFAKEIHAQAMGLDFPLTVRSISPISTSEYPTVTRRPAYSTLSTKKIEHYLGYAPRNWQVALKDYLIKVQKNQQVLQSVD